MTTDHQAQQEPPDPQEPQAPPAPSPHEPPQTSQPPPSFPSQEACSLGLAISSLILGFISLAYSIFLIGALFAVIGIILGAMHLKKRDVFRAMAIWGIILSSVGLISSISLGALYYLSYVKVQKMFDDFDDDDQVAEENWEGVIAPELAITSLEGEQIKLSDLRGKRVVIDFWATWCPPCVKEIPHFIKLKEAPEAADLVIVGVSSEQQEVLKEFVKKHGVNYMIASMKDEDLPSPYKDIRSIPTTFFVDRNGVIQTVLQGYHDYDKLKATALADDFKGEAKTSPDERKPENF